MNITGAPPPLLTTIPGGTLLAGLLRLILCAEQREEFLGDLVEEAHLRLPSSSRRQLAIWLWEQTLRSLPTLLGLRLSRLAAMVLASARTLPGQPHGRGGHGVLVGSRVAHRRLPMSLAVSVSAHALIIFTALTWVLSRVDEVDPSRSALDLWASVLPDPTDVHDVRELSPAAPSEDPTPTRRVRPSRRRAPSAALPAPAPSVPASLSTTTLTASGPAATTAEPAAAAALPGMARTNLPPHVAEKRCLVCPPPRLEYLQARIASGREMVVRTCVSAAGTVSSVDILGSFGRVIDGQVTETIRSWRLLPYRVDGRPVPFCYVTRFLFTTH